jgi:hypothetical protein
LVKVTFDPVAPGGDEGLGEGELEGMGEAAGNGVADADGKGAPLAAGVGVIGAALLGEGDVSGLFATPSAFELGPPAVGTELSPL